MIVVIDRTDKLVRCLYFARPYTQLYFSYFIFGLRHEKRGGLNHPFSAKLCSHHPKLGKPNHPLAHPPQPPPEKSTFCIECICLCICICILFVFPRKSHFSKKLCASPRRPPAAAPSREVQPFQMREAGPQTLWHFALAPKSWRIIADILDNWESVRSSRWWTSSPRASTKQPTWRNVRFAIRWELLIGIDFNKKNVWGKGKVWISVYFFSRSRKGGCTMAGSLATPVEHSLGERSSLFEVKRFDNVPMLIIMKSFHLFQNILHLKWV